MDIYRPLETILKIISIYENSKINIKLDEKISEICDIDKLDNKTRAIVYARTMQLFRRYDDIKLLVKKYLRKKVAHEIYYLLLIGTSEILLNTDQNQKAINGICNFSKIKYAKMSNFIYAILKNIERNEKNIEHHENQLITSQLSIYDKDKINSIYQAWDNDICIFLKVNKNKISQNDYIKLLDEAMISYQSYPSGLAISNKNKIINLPGYNQGLFYIQDYHASFVDEWLKNIKGNLWDACAAPGGKTMSAAQYDLDIYATDNNLPRLNKLKQNLERLSLNNIKTAHIDILNNNDISLFDNIILDLPCSGSGVYAKHPESKLSLNEKKLKELNKIQQAMLEQAWKKLKVNGELLYITCSIFKDENNMQIETFLENNSDAEIIKLNFDNAINTLTGSTLLPTKNLAGGFFFALIKKAEKLSKD